MKTSLSLTESMHNAIKTHLFPGDGLEAVAVAICGRSIYKGECKLLINEIIAIPYEECDRTEGLLKHSLWWSTWMKLTIDRIPNFLNQFTDGLARITTTEAQ